MSGYISESLKEQLNESIDAKMVRGSTAITKGHYFDVKTDINKVLQSLSDVEKRWIISDNNKYKASSRLYKAVMNEKIDSILLGGENE